MLSEWCITTNASFFSIFVYKIKNIYYEKLHIKYRNILK